MPVSLDSCPSWNVGILERLMTPSRGKSYVCRRTPSNASRAQSPTNCACSNSSSSSWPKKKTGSSHRALIIRLGLHTTLSTRQTRCLMHLRQTQRSRPKHIHFLPERPRLDNTRRQFRQPFGNRIVRNPSRIRTHTLRISETTIFAIGV